MKRTIIQKWLKKQCYLWSVSRFPSITRWDWSLAAGFLCWPRKTENGASVCSRLQLSASVCPRWGLHIPAACTAAVVLLYDKSSGITIIKTHNRVTFYSTLYTLHLLIFLITLCILAMYSSHQQHNIAL